MRHTAQLPAYSLHVSRLIQPFVLYRRNSLGKKKKNMESQFSTLFTSAKAHPNPICEPRSTQGCLGLVLAAMVHINSFHMAEESCFPHECYAPCTHSFVEVPRVAGNCLEYLNTSPHLQLYKLRASLV